MISYFRDYAARLFALGYLPLPIIHGQKRPALQDWTKYKFKPDDAKRWPDHGVGLILGTNGVPVVGLDIDIPEPELAAAACALAREMLGVTIERVGAPPKTMLLYRMENPGVPKITGFWLQKGAIKGRAELLASGQQLVALARYPGSNRDYEWGLSGSVLDTPAAELPLTTPDAIHGYMAALTTLAQGMEWHLVVGATVVQLRPAQAAGAVLDPLMRDDERVADVTLADAAAMLAHLSSESRETWIAAGMSLHHQFGDDDEAYALWDQWSSDASTYKGVEETGKLWGGFGAPVPGRRPLTMRWIIKQANTAGYSKVATAAKAKAAAEEAAPWTRGLEMDGTGTRALPNLQNVCHVLSCDPSFNGVVRFNRLAQGVVLVKPVPWRNVIEPGFGGQPWGPADDAALRSYLQRGVFRPKEIKSRDIIEARSCIELIDSYDPLVQMLDALPPWDGVDRINTLLSKFLLTPDTAYERAAMRKWMVGLVKRAYEPGCKFDQVLILIGATGIFKSGFFKTLAMHDELFFDGMPAPEGNTLVEAKRSLAGKWIVEWSDLSSMHKSEVESVKAFVTSQVDDYRPMRADVLRHAPRRCGFGGTANEEQPLKDRSGNRRFWPVVCGRKAEDPLDVAALVAIKESLWAQAIALYRAGEQPFMDTPELIALAGLAQGEALDDDDLRILAGAISNWIASNERVSVDFFNRDTRDLGGQGNQESATMRLTRMTLEKTLVEVFNWRPGDKRGNLAKDVRAAWRLVPGWRGDRFKIASVTCRGWSRVESANPADFTDLG